MIDQSIKNLLQDGQLDNCPLKLDDLSKIKGTLMENMVYTCLSGLYHSRPEYPSKKKMINLKINNLQKDFSINQNLLNIYVQKF
ncbi:MAG: hypothetical protein CM1200mP31_1010 [Candidatus Neomarinimicrobiota bacterium]|nr:MAG: hypothetical protein CM1200mP31_1010 [Candidatus Neomarinimicrobiota bacterium]